MANVDLMRSRYLQRLMLVSVAVAALMFTNTHPLRAESPIQVRASEAQAQFPRGISFRLDAESTAGISDVTLVASTPARRYGGATFQLRPTFTPGERVQASYTWSRFGTTMPPGVEVRYLWRITAADGTVTETPAATVTLEDTRRDWRELRDGTLTVRWYNGDESFGRAVLEGAKEGINRASTSLGIEPRYPLNLYVYGSQNDLREAVPGAPDWIGGIAIPEFDTVMVGFDLGNLAWGRRAMTHEVTHQLVYQMTAHPTLGSRVPVWLNEGLAVVSEGETEAQNARLVRQAVAADDLPTLRGLSTSFSRSSGHLAGASYAASESAVRYLAEKYGPDAMRTMLLGLGEGLSAEEAAQRAYGRSIDQLEDGWRRSLGLEPRDRAAASEPNPQAPEPLPEEELTESDDVSLWVAFALVALALLAAVGGTVLVIRATRR